MRWTGLSLLALVATALRLSRLPFRWNQISLAYAGFYHDYIAALPSGGVYRALSTLVGAHPPLYSLYLASVMALSPQPAVWLLASGLWSLLALPALWWLCRPLGAQVRWLATALLAVSCYAVYYALEIADYPMLLALSTLQLGCFWRFARDPRRWPAFLLSSILLPYCHFLGFFQLLAQGLWTLGWRRPRLRRLVPLALVIALWTSPLFAAAWINAVEEGARINTPLPPWEALSTVLRALPARFPPLRANLLFLPLVAVGGLSAARRPGRLPGLLLLHLLVVGGGILWMVAEGIASTWQFPYYTLLLVPWLVLGASAPRALRRALPGAVGSAAAAVALALVVLCGSAKGFWLLHTWRQARAGQQAAWRTHPSVRVCRDLVQPGDAAILFAPATFLDDDKDVLDPAYTLLDPWAGWRFWDAEERIPGFLYNDPYWGTPYEVEGRIWFSYTGLEPDEQARWPGILEDRRAHGGRLFICHYDIEAAPQFRGQLRAFFAAHGWQPTVLMDGPLGGVYRFDP